MSANPEPHGQTSELRGPAPVSLHISRAPVQRRPSVPVLRVVAGPDLLRFLPMTVGQSYVVGRDEAADFVFPEPSVSRQHAVVTVEGPERFLIEDLGSTNGTEVNGRPVQSAFLRPGDAIQIGAIGFRLDVLDLAEIAHLTRVQAKLFAADSDRLTGLRTRAFLDVDLPELVQRLRAGGQTLSGLFLDIDEFKRINDAHGHRVGDEVLRDVGRIIALNLRATDVGVRYGGDEIIVFLPGTEEAEAVEIGERIRRQVAVQDWGRHSPGLAITCSVGAATLKEFATVQDWLDSADAALYAAKQAGRNRVILAQP
jgi:diguanylate cyclase (GGDEF)-like protein